MVTVYTPAVAIHKLEFAAAFFIHTYRQDRSWGTTESQLAAFKQKAGVVDIASDATISTSFRAELSLLTLPSL